MGCPRDRRGPRRHMGDSPGDRERMQGAHVMVLGRRWGGPFPAALRAHAAVLLGEVCQTPQWPACWPHLNLI